MKGWLLSFALLGSLAVAKPVLAESTSPSRTHWLLLHGIWPGSGRDWRFVAPLLREQGAMVLRPSLPARAGLFAWAEAIVGYLERVPSELYVVAHSFSGAATLFMLRTAYELQHGNLKTLIARLDCASFTGRAAYACRQLSEGWQQLLSETERATRWIGAAKKIERVFLYHPALRGACGACWDLWGFGGGDTTASLCLLAEIAGWLFTPIERVTWESAIAVTNLYGGSEWMLSLCGLQDNDFALRLEQQRLSLEGHNYREVFVGRQLHFAFALRRSAAEKLVTQLSSIILRR
ncbi:hypothetical protein LM602_08045 [Candidatus Acetothermia bacterium]|jgi:hypothetical protein|nr:hypothetical protein [Candidatus Acetothermia bacterium]MCI2432481.1 hypothetical protein [Candidatus Acetothermia bacterium]MCI2436337.1 hypothetical protein [Candidatus Acetothermia bacterium]